MFNPIVGKEQQLEGLSKIIETTPAPVFNRILNNLVMNGFLNRSQRQKYLSFYRELKGWSHAQLQSELQRKDYSKTK